MHARRPRPPSIRPAQVQQLRARLADSERLATFLAQELRIATDREHIRIGEIAELRGRYELVRTERNRLGRLFGLRYPDPPPDLLALLGRPWEAGEDREVH